MYWFRLEIRMLGEFSPCFLRSNFSSFECWEWFKSKRGYGNHSPWTFFRKLIATLWKSIPQYEIQFLSYWGTCWIIRKFGWSCLKINFRGQANCSHQYYSSHVFYWVLLITIRGKKDVGTICQTHFGTVFWLMRKISASHFCSKILSEDLEYGPATKIFLCTDFV